MIKNLIKLVLCVFGATIFMKAGLSLGIGAYAGVAIVSGMLIALLWIAVYSVWIN